MSKMPKSWFVVMALACLPLWLFWYSDSNKGSFFGFQMLVFGTIIYSLAVGLLIERLFQISRWRALFGMGAVYATLIFLAHKVQDDVLPTVLTDAAQPYWSMLIFWPRIVIWTLILALFALGMSLSVPVALIIQDAPRNFTKAIQVALVSQLLSFGVLIPVYFSKSVIETPVIKAEIQSARNFRGKLYYVDLSGRYVMARNLEDFSIEEYVYEVVGGTKGRFLELRYDLNDPMDLGKSSLHLIQEDGKDVVVLKGLSSGPPKLREPEPGNEAYDVDDLAKAWKFDFSHFEMGVGRMVQLPQNQCVVSFGWWLVYVDLLDLRAKIIDTGMGFKIIGSEIHSPVPAVESFEKARQNDKPEYL